MKKIILVLVFVGAVLLPGLLTAQSANAPSSSSTQLTRFDLDFPGGTPESLVKAIEKASGHPLNAIIAPEYANEPMPPLRMKSVNVAELFWALALASQKTINQPTGYYGGFGLPSQQYQTFTVSCGFQCHGDLRDESIWVFFKNVPPPPPGSAVTPDRICRFFQLGPYLEKYKVEDITTAIESGWNMLGDTTPSPAQLSFHKDTKLLIAVGTPEKLKLIDAVLEQLTPGLTTPAVPTTAVPPPAPIGGGGIR